MEEGYEKKDKGIVEKITFCNLRKGKMQKNNGKICLWLSWNHFWLFGYFTKMDGLKEVMGLNWCY